MGDQTHQNHQFWWQTKFHPVFPFFLGASIAATYIFTLTLFQRQVMNLKTCHSLETCQVLAGGPACILMAGQLEP
jgi:hypothetical protein